MREKALCCLFCNDAAARADCPPQAPAAVAEHCAGAAARGALLPTPRRAEAGSGAALAGGFSLPGRERERRERGLALSLSFARCAPFLPRARQIPTGRRAPRIGLHAPSAHRPAPNLFLAPPFQTPLPPKKQTQQSGKKERASRADAAASCRRPQTRQAALADHDPCP